MLGEILSAYEFMDHGSMECVRDNLHLSNPISDSPFYILLETSGSSNEHDEQKLNAFLETVMGESLVLDGTIATEPSKMKVYDCMTNSIIGLNHYNLLIMCNINVRAN